MKKVFLFAILYLSLQGSLSAQCLSLINCPAAPPVFCDTSANNTYFWNDYHFKELAIGSHDLGEQPIDLSTRIIACGSGSEVQAWFVLFLDLNGDGSRETAISSLALPGADTVFFGNAFQPNYSGGVASHFDARPVPASQKYRFVLEKTIDGDTLTVRLRWASAAAPTTYVLPQLPSGLQRIEWHFAKDGETKTCSYLFSNKDCAPPVISCQTGLALNIPASHYISLTAPDLLQFAADNHTPFEKLEFGLRRAGTGTGFPLQATGIPANTLLFQCTDLGAQSVELWARDAAGNASYCITSIIVQDNNGNCVNGNANVDVCVVNHCDGLGVPDVWYEFIGSSNTLPPFTMIVPPMDTGSCISSIINAVPISANATITPYKDDHPLQGVSTHDLVLIARHIEGLYPLGSPYRIIAADANKSGSVTTFDILELRKLILGVYQELPANTSWRFVDKSFVFPNTDNPFQTAFPENITFTNLQGGVYGQLYGIKTGDVDCSEVGHSVAKESLSIPNLSLETNAVAEVPVQFLQLDAPYGYQFGLQFDPAKIKVLEVLPGLGNQDNFGLFPDRVNVSWSTSEPIIQFPSEPLFSLRIQALAPLQLADVFTLATGDLHAEAYPTVDGLVDLQLSFATVATTEPDANRQIFAPQPNPTTAGVRIALRLDEPATVGVELLDVTGRLLYRQEQPGRSGGQWIEIPASAFPQAGLYLWRVKAGTASRSGRIVKQ